MTIFYLTQFLLMHLTMSQNHLAKHLTNHLLKHLTNHLSKHLTTHLINLTTIQLPLNYKNLNYHLTPLLTLALELHLG